ncbi:putative primase zinc finger [Lyophyllum shimeji]|uniref:Primase zinc finger n=1 Tax=Lyophyllum shimeji TaxID=47721 RepID=A0A9P3PWE1_LYOSH|nr:putative primase zinc finger [Lyophyllum shimeji]
MDSSTKRAEEERKRQGDIRRKIAELQAQLKDVPPDDLATASVSPPASPKRKRPDYSTLVPATPSPKKRRLNHRPPAAAPSKPVTQSERQVTRATGSSRHAPGSAPSRTVEPQFAKPAASNLLSNLAKLNHKHHDLERNTIVARSSGFTEKPPLRASQDDQNIFDECSARKRDDRLSLIEELEPGPVDHVPPADDPNFEKLEPNSGIRLSSRTVSHEDLQEHLTGRFYLSPSQLYSCIRLLPDKLGYDIPVPGDWITIAVVAERGPLKFSKAPVAMGREAGDDAEKKEGWKGKAKAQEDASKPSGKKYVNIKLIDFGARSRSSSSATGGKAVIRGDAFLSLLLFESDGFDLVTEEGQSKPRKVYKGGSRGAFESMAKLKEGDVIALLNPRVLKPYQRSSDTPHPVNNILAITPESASSIMTIGRARDLGMCCVLKRDNTVCGSWVDKRVSDVCEWHVQHAVERRRAGRAEFSIGTTGMSTSVAPKRKPAYDPARQWGLKPEASSAGGGSTYIVSGQVVSNSNMDARSLYVAENIGRDGQAKAARKLSGKDADRALKSLLERDKEGMRAVMRAREAGKRVAGELKVEGKGKGPEKQIRKSSNAEEDILQKPASLRSTTTTTKNAYSAQVIKQLGFDPIAMAGQSRGTRDLDVQNKLRSLEALQSSRKEIILGPRPGQRIRSGVVAPVLEDCKTPLGTGEVRYPDDSDDELPVHPIEHKEDAMIDLDD